MNIKKNFEEATKILQEFLENDSNFKAIETAGKIMVNAIKNGGKIFSCGNGGSMCDAMHFAEELTGSFQEKRKAIPAIAISDPAHITCTANDFGWNFVFSRYIEALGNSGDVLLAISTSGNSENIIEVAKTAKEKGIKIVALTGKTGGKLKNICDVEIRSPQSKYSDRVQEIHIKVIHSLIEYIEKELETQK
ncbi:D-sedoheptulose 7-phosphate isomerase [Bacteroidales bacterium OttesenSCG-928-I21]|nr:D-sedoheptulose 7-phosphate isomerase [Bacteroidales bacterium OttesenSCG-928-I21]